MTSNDASLISGSADKTSKVWPMEFFNNLSKAQEYFENKETQLAQDLIKGPVMSMKNINDLLELFILTNSFSHPFDTQVA